MLQLRKYTKRARKVILFTKRVTDRRLLSLLVMWILYTVMIIIKKTSTLRLYYCKMGLDCYCFFIGNLNFMRGLSLVLLPAHFWILPTKPLDISYSSKFFFFQYSFILSNTPKLFLWNFDAIFKLFRRIPSYSIALYCYSIATPSYFFRSDKPLGNLCQSLRIKWPIIHLYTFIHNVRLPERPWSRMNV